MKTAKLAVSGMHCEGCAQIIQSVLERCDGVKTCAVSYRDHRAQVLFDPAQVDENRLQQVIEKAGYGVITHAHAPGPHQ